MFNTALAKPRVSSEHCIGMLKGRFPWLRQIRMKIKKNARKSLRQILKYVEVCIVLHNLLIDNREDDVPEDWIDYDKFSDLDDDDRRPELDSDDELNLAVPGDANKDIRREQLCNYMNETFVL